MKKIVNIIARRNLINPQTKEVYDDKDLFAFDNILFGERRIIDSSIDDHCLLELLKNDFEINHPDFKADSYELVQKCIGDEQ